MEDRKVLSLYVLENSKVMPRNREFREGALWKKMKDSSVLYVWAWVLGGLKGVMVA